MSGGILYLKFLGARAYQERLDRGLAQNIPLMVSHQDIVFDCDEVAFKNGVRPGDTLRQAKLACPSCHVVRVTDRNAIHLKGILDILAKTTPYIEPDEDENGVFVGLTRGDPVKHIMNLMDRRYFLAIAGNSRSKFLAKASSGWFLKKYLKNQKIFPGKKEWGSVDVGSGYVLISIDHGKEKNFSAHLPLTEMWTAPPEVVSTLYSLGFKSLEDIQGIAVEELSRHVGEWAGLLKEWAFGKDFSHVRPLYPPPFVIKEINFQDPVSAIGIEALEPVLREISEDFLRKGIGFKAMTLSLSGDFGIVSGEKRLVRPICSIDSVKMITKALLDEIQSKVKKSPGDNQGLFCSISSVSLKIFDTAQVSATPLPLFWSLQEKHEKTNKIPASLELVLLGLEEKYGDNAVNLGCTGARGGIFKPEILRREKMLSLWDPVRIAGAAPCIFSSEKSEAIS